MLTVKHRELILLPLLAAVGLSLAGAFLLRFDFTLPAAERPLLELGLCIFLPVKGIWFYVFGVHRSWWRLVGVFDLLRVILANVAASVTAAVAAALIIGPAFPRSVYVIDAALCFLSTAGLQFSIRLYREVWVPGANGTDRRRSILID
jgi:FlaA1/EpsC-like NDP-sugar epimerase